MTEQHPLTTAQIKKLAKRYTLDMESGVYAFGEDAVRAAADWQLEQVIEWIEECSNYDLDFHSECRRMIADLKKALRPQEYNFS